ncbi:MAG: protein-glutamate methylesterase/protein-glutamine glutaminase [Nitrospirales bacterium]
MSSNIRVLIVDDSAFIRNALSGMLSKAPGIDVVGIAHHGEEALMKVKKLSPDVMTLDIEMPGINGMQVLESVMAHSPLPVIMVSSLTQESAWETLHALELGAIDFISKQLNGSILNISKIEKILVSKVKAAAKAKVFKKCIAQATLNRRKAADSPYSRVKLERYNEIGSVPGSVVIIGSSTGGPRVVQEILEEFPSTFSAAVVIVQHMPKFFTKSFAERLNQVCPLRVDEAKDGDPLVSGQVLVAPGSQHIQLESHADRQVRVRVSREPVDLPYRPSIDLAMESAAKIFGPSVVGVILTGMGNDGARGIQAINTAGGCSLVQDEETSVIYGMPKAAIENGDVDAVMPGSRIASEIISRISLVNKHEMQYHVKISK